MRGSRQGGSVLNFIVIGVAVVLLLLVGAYVVKTYVVNYESDAGEVAVETEGEVSDENESDTSSDDESPAADADDTQDTTKTDDESVTVNGDESTDSTTESESTTDESDHGTVNELPQTGLESHTVLQVFGFSVLGGATVLFGASRRD